MKIAAIMKENRPKNWFANYFNISNKSNVSNGFLYIQVCAFNRTVSKVESFMANEAKGTKVIGATSLEDMVSKLKKPRRVMMLVKAGSAVDSFIDMLVSQPLVSVLFPSDS